MDKWIKTVETLLAANNGVDMQHATTSELYRAVSRATMAEIAEYVGYKSYNGFWKAYKK